MRHIQSISLNIIIFLFATTCNAQQQSLEEQAEKIASEVKVNLTQGLGKLFSFFKATEKKANSIMYQTRDGFDQMIYDAQKQYDDENQHHEPHQDNDYCIYSVYHCQTP